LITAINRAPDHLRGASIYDVDNQVWGRLFRAVENLSAHRPCSYASAT
jgi:hypothetical protein